MTFSLVLALIAAAVPCEPLERKLLPLVPRGTNAIGWTRDDRLIAAFGRLHAMQVDVFAHELKWVADFRGGDRPPTMPRRSGTVMAGPPGVYLVNERLTDEAGSPLQEIDPGLRADIATWRWQLPSEYSTFRVAKTDRDEWLIIANTWRAGSDYRAFIGRNGSLAEHPLQWCGMGLDGGSISIGLALDGRIVRWNFPPSMYQQQLELEVSVGQRRLEGWREVPRTELPTLLRFTCLEPLPHERWWPEPPPN